MSQSPYPGSPSPAAARPWSRLHPLSPLVQFGRAGALVLFLVGTSALSGSRGSHSGSAVVPVLVGVLGSVAALVSWLVTRWRVEGGDLQIVTGLVRRQSYRIPLARIQAVDVIAPLLARLLGLAEVRVVVAGQGAQRGRLAYLSSREARTVRAELLALAHGLAAGTPEPPALPVLRVDNGRLALGVLLSAPTGAALVLIAAASVPTGAGRAAVGVALSLVVAAAGSMVHRLNSEFNFSIAEAPDGLRMQRGGIQVRTETIPYGRIQAVRWVQPLLWMPFGWCRLEVDVARQRETRAEGSDPQMTRALLPIGTRVEAAWLLSRTLPGATLEPPQGSEPPPRARFKAPLSYHYLRVWDDGRYLSTRTGRVRPATVILPLEKAQSLRLNSGPIQRALRLASVEVDTAGHRWKASAPCRDDEEAARLLDRLSLLAREARRRIGARADGVV